MTRRRKRGRSSNPPPPSKRHRRPPPPQPQEADAEPSTEWRSRPAASTLFVTGLPPGCTVLELKSRLEMYGPISRTRVDATVSSAQVTFRSADAADAALAAAIDPDCGIAVRSHPVEVYRASDPVPQWRIAVGASSSSRLLRAELPLSRVGRSNKKLNADTAITISGQNLPYKGREIVAYDDLF